MNASSVAAEPLSQALLRTFLSDRVRAVAQSAVDACVHVASPPAEHVNLLQYETHSELLFMVVLPLTLSLVAVHLVFRNAFLIVISLAKLAIALTAAAWMRAAIAPHIRIASVQDIEHLHAVVNASADSWADWLADTLAL